MMDTLLNMSTKELSRLEVMQRLAEKQLSEKETGEILRLSTRQIKRLLKAYTYTQGKCRGSAPESIFTYTVPSAFIIK